jgi:hypothetical protein
MQPIYWPPSFIEADKILMIKSFMLSLTSSVNAAKSYDFPLQQSQLGYSRNVNHITVYAFFASKETALSSTLSGCLAYQAISVRFCANS